ncbi:MAG: serine/threonine-protein kinase, partial [Thermoanaerobaculia bacterium]
MIGTALGNYRITAKLGEGGMGEVWRATDSKLQREVAIKVLPAAFIEDKERLARFEREAQLLAQLHHPNIASIFGLEESEGVRALVMELVEGEDLAERLARGPLPLGDALTIARQIAEALEVAHDKGIVHRDLKPANIMLTADGTIKVLDFGLAKALDPAGAAHLPDKSPAMMNSPTLTAAGTQLGMILGTAAYMSPEQAKGLPVDKRADIWAFGVLVHEMLAGRRLFAGDSVTETLASVLRNDIDFSTLPAATPAAIRALLRRCLERSPKNRLRDIGDARIALDEVIRGDGAIEPSLALPSRGASRREIAAWVAAGVLAAIALGLGAFLWRRGAPAPLVPRFTQLTFAPQFLSNARFAPDGRTVVSSAAREGNRSELFVHRSGDPQPRALGRAE